MSWTLRTGWRALAVATVVVNALVGALLFALVSFVLESGRRAYAVQAHDTAEDLVAIAQEDVGSELSRVDAVLQATILALGSLPDSRRSSGAAEINRILREHRQLLPSTEGLRFADASGRVHWGNELPGGADVNVSDRDYFIWAKSHLHGQVYLAGPLQSRVSGNWVIALVRPVIVDGRFDGILYASVPVEHFGALFARYSLDNHDAITLRTTRLALVARFAPGSGASQPIGSTAVSRQLRDATAVAPLKGSFVSETLLDRIERTSAYQQVSGWPLLVVGGIGNDRYFAPWVAQAGRIRWLAFLAWGLIAISTFALLRTWLRASEHLRALRRETRREQALLRVAGDGIHVVDQRGYLLQMSESFAQMLRSTPARLSGRHISDWDANRSREDVDAWLATLRDGDRQLVEVRHRRDDGSVIDVELQLNATRIDGELLVFGSSRDVTERKRLQASLEESVRRANDLYENAPCGYHSMNPGGVLIHVNKTMLAWLGCRAEEVIGRTRLSDFMDDEGRMLFAENFPQVRAGARLDGLEFRLLPRTGPPRRLRATVSAVLDESGSFVMSRASTQDISAVHEATQAMARLLEEQSAMLDNDIVGMVKLRDRVSVWCNRALDRIFGYASGQLAGRSSRILYADDASYEALGAAAYTAIKSGLHYRTQLRMRHADGHLIWIDLTGVNLSDNVSFWMMVDITAMKESHARIEHIAFHDPLTQLPNRLLLTDRLRQAVLAAEREQRSVAVCYLDLDGFKEVNDSRGHDAGDEVLVEIGRRLTSSLRGTDTAARLGGDEFIVLLTSLEGDEWRLVVDRLLAVIGEPVRLSDGGVALVAGSIGVAVSPIDGLDPSDLIVKADQAMLRAKRAGKGRMETATPALPT